MKIITKSDMLKNSVFTDNQVATCKECCSQRILISINRMDGEEIWTVSCPNCHHNISSRTLENAINTWNQELKDEGDDLDFATEVVLI